MTTTKPDVDLAGIRKIVEAPFDHEQYVSNNLWLVEQVPALLDLVDAQKAEIAALEARAFAHAGREERMRTAVEECREYFDQRADITDRTDDDGRPFPNEEMRMLSLVDEVLK